MQVCALLSKHTHARANCAQAKQFGLKGPSARVWQCDVRCFALNIAFAFDPRCRLEPNFIYISNFTLITVRVGPRMPYGMTHDFVSAQPLRLGQVVSLKTV